MFPPLVRASERSPSPSPSSLPHQRTGMRLRRLMRVRMSKGEIPPPPLRPPLRPVPLRQAPRLPIPRLLAMKSLLTVQAQTLPLRPLHQHQARHPLPLMLRIRPHEYTERDALKWIGIRGTANQSGDSTPAFAIRIGVKLHSSWASETEGTSAGCGIGNTGAYYAPLVGTDCP